MAWTMKQAVKHLEKYAVNGPFSVRDDIVEAMQSLADIVYLDSLRQVIRFRTFGGGRFALPQQFECIVRAAINGKPTTVRGVEYNFLYAGPGDLDQLPSGYVPGYGLVDEQAHPPLTLAPASAYSVVASMPGYTGSAALTAVFEAGRLSIPIVDEAVVLAATAWSELSAASVLESHGSISRMLVPDDDLQQGLWVQLWAGPESSVPANCSAGKVSSSVRVPLFRHYHLPTAEADQAYEILAEVRPAFVHTHGDDDIVPFQSLMPIQLMMQAHRYFANGELDAGAKYQQLAVGSMVARDDANTRKQTTITFNNAYDESPGQDSMSYVNI